VRDNKVIGLINSMGVSSFKNNPPLDPFSVEEVFIYTEFFVKNHKYILDNPVLYTAFADGLKHCSDNDIDVDDFNLILYPITGKEYDDMLIKTMDHLELFDSLKTFITTSSGMFFSPERIALYKIEEDNDETYFNIDNLFPIEFNKDYVYLVIKIDGEDNDSCDDRSFESLSVINEQDKTLNQTFIRVANKNGRWSDWLEFTEDVLLNINTFKLLLETEILVHDSVYKNSFEDILYDNYVITCNLLKDNGESISIDYDIQTDYIEKDIFLYSFSYDYELDISCIKSTFIELNSNNISYNINYN